LRVQAANSSPARLEVTTDGTEVVGHAGAALLQAASPGQAATTSADDQARFSREWTLDRETATYSKIRRLL
jgi:hypothetical protein